MNTQRISDNVNRLVLTLCQRDLKALRAGIVQLVIVGPLFVELVDAVEANPVGIEPPFMSALATLREQMQDATEAGPVGVVDVVRLSLPFGYFAAMMGAALRSNCSLPLRRAIGKSLNAVTRDLDADAPATAEVLQQIADELLETE